MRLCDEAVRKRALGVALGVLEEQMFSLSLFVVVGCNLIGNHNILSNLIIIDKPTFTMPKCVKNDVMVYCLTGQEQ